MAYSFIQGDELPAHHPPGQRGVQNAEHALARPLVLQPDPSTEVGADEGRLFKGPIPCIFPGCFNYCAFNTDIC